MSAPASAPAIHPVPEGLPAAPPLASPASPTAPRTAVATRPAVRRREAREPRACPARLSVLPRPPSWPASEPAHVRDESPGGLCLLAARAPVPGTLVRIEIRRLDGEDARPVLARVRWRRAEPGLGTRIGVEILAERAAASAPGGAALRKDAAAGGEGPPVHAEGRGVPAPVGLGVAGGAAR